MLRRFGLLMAGALGLVALLLGYKEKETAALVCGGLAGFFAISSLLFPLWLRPVYAAWMRLARVLGWVNTHLLLALLFYTLFTLVGLVLRLLRRDPLARRWDVGAQTYWSARQTPLLPRDHYERQF